VAGWQILKVMPGTYDAFLSVGDADGTPRIALPHAGDDGHRRYHLGRIALTPPKGDFEIAIGAVSIEGRQVTVHVTWTISAPAPDSAVPFGHVTQGPEGKDGIIGFGQPDGFVRGSFSKEGTVRCAMVFDIPESLDADSCRLRIGIFVPDSKDLPMQRVAPTGSDGLRRVLLGDVRVNPDGALRFIPVPSTP
jgi:hypothetical protein